MKKKSILTSVSLTIIVVVLLSAMTVFAETNENATEDVDKADFNGRFIMNKIRRQRVDKEEIDLEKVKELRVERFKSMLANLVEEGIITEEQSDVIIEKHEEFISDLEARIKERKPIFEQLIEEGILTEEEVNAVKEALSEIRQERPRARIFDKENRKENRKEIFNENLSGLVEEGILTQEKVDQITSFLEDKIVERQEIRNDNGFWEQMVDSGIISEEELEEIKENCNKHPMVKYKFNRKLRNSRNQ